MCVRLLFNTIPYSSTGFKFTFFKKLDFLRLVVVSLVMCFLVFNTTPIVVALGFVVVSGGQGRTSNLRTGVLDSTYTTDFIIVG